MDEPFATATRPAQCCAVDAAVLGVHFLPGDTAARQAFLDAGLPWVSVPGELAGADPIVAWTAPRELVVLGRQTEPMRMLQRALAQGCYATALAVDRTEATAVLELHGPSLDDWLARLVDASAFARETGRASRCRMADVPVLLLRLSTDRLWLTVDRPLLPYVNEWLAYAHAGAFAPQISKSLHVPRPHHPLP